MVLIERNGVMTGILGALCIEAMIGFPIYCMVRWR